MRMKFGWLVALAIGLPGVGLAGTQDAAIDGSAWMALQRTATCACTIYIDLMHSLHGPNSATILAIQDFDHPVESEGRKLLSTAFRSEFSCSDEVYNTLHSASFSDHMGHGEVLMKAETASGWRNIPPDAPWIHLIRNIACNPKDFLR